MPRFLRRRAVLLLLVSSGVSCAGTTTQFGRVSPGELIVEEARQKEFVIARQLEQEQRLLNVGFPLLRSASSFCAGATTEKPGLKFGSAATYANGWQDAARAVGISDTVTILAVAKGSPAERAGLQGKD